MNLKQEIKSHIRDVKDFPKKGIVFKDITPILKNPLLCTNIVKQLSSYLSSEITHVIGVESRGFLFGFLLANKMGIPFIPIRKSGKLPGETLRCKYDLEYGSAEVEVHKSDIKKGWNVVVHDDLLATGGTACAASELMKELEVKVVAFAFIISFDFLNGNEKLEQYSKEIISLKRY